MIRQKNLATVLQVKSLRADGCRNDGSAHREGFDNLQTRSPANSQRDNLEPRLAIIGANIRHAARDDHVGFLPVSDYFISRLFADHPHCKVRNQFSQQLVNFLKVPAKRVDVRVVSIAPQKMRDGFSERGSVEEFGRKNSRSTPFTSTEIGMVFLT